MHTLTQYSSCTAAIHHSTCAVAADLWNVCELKYYLLVLFPGILWESAVSKVITLSQPTSRRSPVPTWLCKSLRTWVKCTDPFHPGENRNGTLAIVMGVQSPLHIWPIVHWLLSEWHSWVLLKSVHSEDQPKSILPVDHSNASLPSLCLAS